MKSVARAAAGVGAPRDAVCHTTPARRRCREQSRLRRQAGTPWLPTGELAAAGALESQARWQPRSPIPSFGSGMLQLFERHAGPIRIACSIAFACEHLLRRNGTNDIGRHLDRLHIHGRNCHGGFNRCSVHAPCHEQARTIRSNGIRIGRGMLERLSRPTTATASASE